jgi:hypothetical protein
LVGGFAFAVLDSRGGAAWPAVGYLAPAAVGARRERLWCAVGVGVLGVLAAAVQSRLSKAPNLGRGFAFADALSRVCRFAGLRLPVCVCRFVFAGVLVMPWVNALRHDSYAS